MARPKELIPGNCYFTVAFYDDVRLPIVETLLYVRPEDDVEGVRHWLFQEPERPREPSAGREPPAEPLFICVTDDQLYTVLDFPGLLRSLGEVAADHPIGAVGGPSGFVTPAAAGDQLANQVSAFLTAPECASLTITIRFTDDGLSLDRTEDGHLRMVFHPRPRIEPDREAAVRALFAGQEPEEDYLFNAGRVRMLAFPIPGALETVVALSGRVFAEVYGMRSDDSLKYHLISWADVHRWRAER